MRIAWLAFVLALALAACGSSSPPLTPTPPAPAEAAGQTTAPTAPTASPARPASPYPATERRPVTDTYGDVKVVDDYRWLEAPRDPGVLAWTAAQNQLTRSRIDALPDRAKIHQRVSELLS